MLYTIVIPCYRSSHTIRKLVELTSEKMREMRRTPFEFILVEDCSHDDRKTLNELRSLADDYDYVKVISLAKNAGQQNAIIAGLHEAGGDIIISMDDDMQTHPSQLPVMFAEIEKGYDIVYGVYKDKKHNKFRNFGSWLNHVTVKILIGKPKHMKTSSYWIAKRFVRDYIIQYTGTYTHIQGLMLRTTENISTVEVEHFAREYGKSGYTFGKLVKLWSNILGYSIVPLRMARNAGFLFFVLSIIGVIVVIVKKILYPSAAVGWYSLMVTLCFFSGLIMLFLGLIGEYLGRMYLGLTNTPQYVIREKYYGNADNDNKDK